MEDYEKFSDEEVVVKVQTNDINLYSVILERYQNKLLRYVGNLVHDEVKATHIVQDAFIKAYVNLNSFNPKHKFSSWIYRIAHNEAINEIKKYQKEVPILDDFDFPSDEDITKDFEQKELESQMEKCLGLLPPMYSEPLSLYYFHSKSYEEICDILRLPMGTVATRISRAKILIKKICQKN